LHLQATIDWAGEGEPNFAVLIVFQDLQGQPIATTVIDDLIARVQGSSVFDLRVPRLPLRPDTYRLMLVTTTPHPQKGYTDHDVVPEALTLEVVSTTDSESPNLPASWGSVRLEGSGNQQGLLTIGKGQVVKRE